MVCGLRLGLVDCLHDLPLEVRVLALETQVVDPGEVGSVVGGEEQRQALHVAELVHSAEGGERVRGAPGNENGGRETSSQKILVIRQTNKNIETK